MSANPPSHNVHWHPYQRIRAPVKTSIELPEALLNKAKRHARARKTTLKALIEQGLRMILAETGKAHGFKLRDASVGGKGLSPEFRNASWEQLRDTIHKGEGA